jgi:ubiquitin-small subunit ribosomal protein S27Ae
MANAKRKNRVDTKMHEKYNNGVLKNKECPKCGPGVLLAEHGNRASCGKCGFTEFKSKGGSPKPTSTEDVKKE